MTIPGTHMRPRWTPYYWNGISCREFKLICCPWRPLPFNMSNGQQHRIFHYNHLPLLAQLNVDVDKQATWCQMLCGIFNQQTYYTAWSGVHLVLLTRRHNHMWRGGGSTLSRHRPGACENIHGLQRNTTNVTSHSKSESSRHVPAETSLKEDLFNWLCLRHFPTNSMLHWRGYSICGIGPRCSISRSKRGGILYSVLVATPQGSDGGQTWCLTITQRTKSLITPPAL